MKEHPSTFFAGQICGVEGYVESIASGMLAGMFASQSIAGEIPIAPPRATGLGSLVQYITHADPKKFQPANITFDLLPPLENRVRDRQERHRMQCDLALRELQGWLELHVTSTGEAIERAF
jgi:methylenetetrahydrofolate--tRNA-(uracil-5-)-methyltransferase